ncbi:MAG: Unknown protein [uncultured Thiotrichaceae bacterium]|uniref:Methyltransferase type 11 domain-containing protein n=1 Tax=uncultured Thiotrichaceae bacterium TaxID=298394 RepID=A0A6S6SG12_9GAMM|nr:MAG: Unknown protein [uncultured Thiotrichaceae bacterium]
MSEFHYLGDCAVCGYHGVFEKNHTSLREGYQCPECKSSLRYRGQAEALLEFYGLEGAKTVKALATQKAFSHLKIYEPGLIGPFRSLFTGFPHYQNSFYWDDIGLGESKDGIVCQSLEALTFADDSFDLIISSDILEHVRKPWQGFAEIYRVLQKGGMHIFSIPVQEPMPALSKARVDTSGDDDVYVEEPHYHGNGIGGRSLVYTDFGKDIVVNLEKMGYHVTLHKMANDYPEVQRLITFVTQK